MNIGKANDLLLQHLFVLVEAFFWCNTPAISGGRTLMRRLFICDESMDGWMDDLLVAVID
jgi:hypothetical protein